MSGQTLAAALAEAAARWPDRPAVRSASGVLTHGELATATARLAAAYARLGVRPGDRVVCQVGNRPEHLVAAGAAWAAAAVHVAAGHEAPGPELSGHLTRTGATLLIYAPPASGVVEPVRYVLARHPEVRVVVVGGGAISGTLDYDRLIADPARPAIPPRAPTPDEAACIFTTSGSTGTPKMPMGHHGRLWRSWTRLGAELDFSPADVQLGHLPLAHGLGLMLMTACLLRGGCVRLVERFSATTALALVAREGITVLPGSPAHFRLLLDHVAHEPGELGSLRIGVASGAAFEPVLLAAIMDRLDMALMLMYGASEGVGVSTMDRSEMLSGSVGVPMPGSVAILDSEGAAVPVGRSGEIAFARECNPVRYWLPASDGRPAGPAPEQGTGWYHSGDLGRFDEMGRLFVLGRIRAQINRGGQKVDPVEVEHALLRCPGVDDVAVLGVANPVLGEVVCACVVPAPGHAVTLPELRGTLGAELARYKLPEELRILDRIPRTGLGKVDTERLRAELSG